MNNFKKFLQMSLVMFAVLIMTSACGSSTNPTPNYFLLYQPDNPQENKISVQINDSLDKDKISTADFYYRSTTDKGKLSKSIKQEKDQAVTNVQPKEDNKETFDVPVPDDINAQNIKIVAIITYDDKKNVLDYWSSYDGIESQNDSFSIDFQNSKDNEAGFGGGSGTEDDPYIISQPRHFANINAQDDEDNYINLDKHFKQTENIDFSNLTGIKIDRTEDDKDITFEKSNPWAPFYNEGHGIPSIGLVTKSSSSQMPGIGTQNNNEDSHKTSFKGTYDGNNLIIDGIHIINSNESNIALFTGTYSATLKNIIIGENSIVFIDVLSGIDSLNISALSSSITNTTIENCTNNAKIIVKELKNVKSIAVSGIATDIQTESENSSSSIIPTTNNNKEESEEEEPSYEYTNCVNKANICIYNNNIEKIYVGGCFALKIMSMDSSMDISSMTSMFSSSDITISKCKNSGKIKITNNKTSKAKGAIVASGVHVNIFSMNMSGMGNMGGNGQGNNNNDNSAN